MWSLAWNMARVWELLVGFPQGQRCLSRGIWGCDSVLEYLPSTHETLASSHFPKGKLCSLATQYERPAVGAVSPKGQSCTGPLQRMQVCYFHPHCPSIIKWRGSIFILASWALCPITLKRMPSFLFCSLFWKKYFSGAANYGMLRFRAIWCPRRIARYGREKQAKDSRTCLHSSTFPPLSIVQFLSPQLLFLYHNCCSSVAWLVFLPGFVLLLHLLLSDQLCPVHPHLCSGFSNSSVPLLGS